MSKKTPSYEATLDAVLRLLGGNIKTAKETTSIDDEYDSGKHEKPEEKLLTDHQEELEAANWSSSDEPSGGAEESLELNPELATEVVTEEEPDTDLRADTGGKEAIEEVEKMAHLSDRELIAEYNRTLNQLIKLAQANSENQFSPAAEFVSHIVKAAEFDADLVGGFLLGQTLQQYDQNVLAQYLRQKEAQLFKTAQESLAEAALEEALEEVEGKEKEGKGVEVTKEDVAEAVTTVLTEVPELVEAMGGNPADFTDPEEVREQVDEVLDENPALAGAVAAVMEASLPEGIELKEEGKEEESEVKKEGRLRKRAQGIDLEQLKDVMNNPAIQQLGQQLGEILAGASTPEEGETEEEEEEEETPSEETEEKETSEEEPAEGEASTAEWLAVLDQGLKEQGMTPEDLEGMAAGGPREEEAKKVAAAIKRFRQTKISQSPAAKRAANNPVLRQRMRNYLNELIFGS